MSVPTNLAVLFGNGLSIAFNENLLIPRITAEIIARLDEAGQTDSPAAQLMQAVAQRAGAANASTDFEALVGPFDEINATLKLLRQMAGLAGERTLSVEHSLTESADFAEAVRRHAVSHILQVIATGSIAHWDQLAQLQTFITATVEAAHGGEVAIGNLNYDALVMAALCGSYSSQMCDLADARFAEESVELVRGGSLVSGRRLRTTGDLPPRRISLLHLHGSLTWLRRRTDNAYMRFPIEALRTSGYWTAWREGRTDWAPVVVLTNQASKTDLVTQYPFKLAYDLFFTRLLSSDKWLIAGTSLGDECVNEMLAKAWWMRTTVPQVMVVTNGVWPSEDHVLKAVGYDPIWSGDPDPSTWLRFHRGGIETVAESRAWASWSAALPIARARVS